MDLFRALILGLVQGVTEFLPISSSAHLVLVPWLLGWGDPGLAFDAMAHWGTLAALVITFRRDLVELARAWNGKWRMEDGKKMDNGQPSPFYSPPSIFPLLIIVGTIPAALAGFLFEDFFESLFGSPLRVAVLLLVTGFILVLSERLGRRWRDMESLALFDALLIGLAQAAAIAPGISRSGATIAAGLLVGLRREAAARISFLLAMPIIFGAGLLQLLRLAQAGLSASTLPPLAVGLLAAAFSGYLSIRFLLAYLQRGKLYPFAVYCWAVGLFVLGRIALRP
jgi:undecaprenyl-diphosphatase